MAESGVAGSGRGGGVSQCVICNVDARVDCALQSGCCLLRVVAVVFAAAAVD